MDVSLNGSDMCRVCVSKKHLIDILLFGKSTAKFMNDVDRYFGVQLVFHDDKSTKVCKKCIRKIKDWRKDMYNAANCQKVIDFLDTMVQRGTSEEREDPGEH